MVAIILSSMLYGDVPDVSYEMPTNGTDVMWNFFLGVRYVR